MCPTNNRIVAQDVSAIRDFSIFHRLVKYENPATKEVFIFVNIRKNKYIAKEKLHLRRYRKTSRVGQLFNSSPFYEKTSTFSLNINSIRNFL